MKTLNFNIYTKIKKWFNPNSPSFSTRLALVVCTILAASGIYIGKLENSLAVQINGLISAIDVLNSAIFLTAVNQSVRSPDYVYNYGYGKYESISILAAGGLLIIVFGYTLYEAILSFGTSPIGGANFYILNGYSFISLLLMVGMYKVQRKASKKFHLPILDYDAQIWKIDAYMEIAVFANLILATFLHYFNLYYVAVVIDSSLAIGLTLIALKIPLKGSRDALNQLLDKTVSESVQFDILGVVVENLTAMCEFKSVHTRQSGKDIFIEIDVVLPNDYTLEQADKLESSIRYRIKELYPTAVPRLYANPCQGECRSNGISNCPVKKAWNEQQLNKNVG